MIWKICSLLVLFLFYGIYLGKMFLQKRKGIQTDQIAKRKNKDRIYYTELIMKIATVSVIAAEALSIILCQSTVPPVLRLTGLVIGFLGVAVFAISVYTMKDSWRAGLAENDETSLITSGIYKYSRNPAFLGFDLVYIGILIVWFNAILAVFSLWAMTMLHLQIIHEERYLATVFGNEYIEYAKRVSRYFGRK